MTEDQSKLMNEFEARVRQLIFLCNDLQNENEKLKDELLEQKQSFNALSEENITLKNKYDNLKIARIISVRQDDFSGAKKRLSQLVREVNKCIALLNE
jgi:hypothetical protein